jgi:hypothetical protein
MLNSHRYISYIQQCTSAKPLLKYWDNGEKLALKLSKIKTVT